MYQPVTTSRIIGALPMPWAALGVRADGGRLAGLDWLAAEADVSPEGGPLTDVERALLERCRSQIERYLEAPVRRFDLPLTEAMGTPFQRRVWAALCAIPAGEVRTYGSLAVELGSGPRAVAQACRANPWTLVVPCHRVVAAGGWGGYGGATDTDSRLLRIKQAILAHEGVASPIHSSSAG